MDPVVVRATGLYNDYGVPAQVKLVSLYKQYGKPLVNEGCVRASQVYAQHLEPKLSPLVEKSKIQADQAKIHLQPYLQEATKQAIIAQNFAKQQWEDLPPPVKQAKDQAVDTVLELYHRAENTDLIPILIDIYWKIIDFYQYQFVPFIQTHPTTAHVNKFYEENVKKYVDENVKPLLLLVKDRTHVNQLFNHALTLFPQRPLINEPKKSTVASSIVETKTPVTTAKAISNIPITATTTAATSVSTSTKKVVTTKVVKSESKASTAKAFSAEPTLSAVPIKEEAISTPLASSSNIAKEEASSTTIISTTAATAATAANSIKTEATVAKDVTNDDDIIKPVSVRPTATPEYVEMEVKSPQADKKEAVYCPTCNAAEEQVMIAPTDKNIAPVRDEKEVFEIQTEKEMFEVNKKPIAVPPQSPVKDTLVKEEENVDAPIKKEPVVSPESKIEEQVVPDLKEEEEEEQIFSTQVEDQMPIHAEDTDNVDKHTKIKHIKKKTDDDLPEPAVPLKEEEEKVETPVVNVVVDKQQVEIPLPVAKEKEKENIIVPNDESEFADTKEQIVINAPVKDEPIFEEKEPIDVEQTAKEPIVPNDESKFDSKPQHNQQPEEPVRYRRAEEALS